MIKSFALIPLSQGLFATIDFEDLEKVGQFKWSASIFRRNDGSELIYAVRQTKTQDGKKKRQYLHRFLLDAGEGQHCDHVNGDGIDCRMSNLRICTKSENGQNQRARTCSSPYKGVCWYGRVSKWCSRISVGGKYRHIGLFLDEREAAKAYDSAAMTHYGKFARLNFPSLQGGSDAR